MIRPLLLSLLLFAAPAAALDLVVTEGGEGAQPIAIVPFAWDSDLPPPSEGAAAIIASDLRLSGQFAPLPPERLPARPHDIDEAVLPDWRRLGLPVLVVGRVEQGALRFQVIDVYRGKLLLHYRFRFDGPAALRRVAHAASDLIHKELTGVPGAFSARIAYVSRHQEAPDRARYRLEVADSDGYNPRTLLTASEPILSPAWSPDGARIAYVTFERGRSVIWVQQVGAGERRRVAFFHGRTSAPAWSPQGRRLAFALTQEGNAEIYILDLEREVLQRATNHRATDTEPAWRPDGGALAFLSDRGGTPQIYLQSLAGGPAQRLTFEGRYNASPVWSPDGRSLALLHGDRGDYRIATLDVESGALKLLTRNRLDESPSFAPNGRMIVYATQAAGRGVLEIVSVDGEARRRLSIPGRDVREPAWAPR